MRVFSKRGGKRNELFKDLVLTLSVVERLLNHTGMVLLFGLEEFGKTQPVSQKADLVYQRADIELGLMAIFFYSQHQRQS